MAVVGIGLSLGTVGKVEVVCSRWRSLWKIARPLLVHLTYISSWAGWRVWGGRGVWGELGD